MDYEDPIVAVSENFVGYKFRLRNSLLNDLVRNLNTKIEQQGHLSVNQYIETINDFINEDGESFTLPMLGALGEIARFTHKDTHEIFGAQCMWTCEEPSKAIGFLTFAEDAIDMSTLHYKRS